ncbi:TetR family transcriptional regulator [Mycobacteriaceae bacterium 1482268.1]|nr:TetR family transcriptional regulator [Mycobacteriaceae bacterium 1482268.1]
MGKPAQARTRLARAAVIDAARTLFVERGYVATTVEAISSYSGVPAATVYRLFTSKRGILKQLLDTSIAGDDEQVSLPERSQVRAVFADPDPRRQLAGLVAIASDVNSRATEIYSVLVGAASADADAAALLEELKHQRREGQGRIARSLARAGALRAGLRERDAADMVYTLLSPEVYRLLVLDRRWPPKRYERWLTQTLAECLLPPDPR